MGNIKILKNHKWQKVYYNLIYGNNIKKKVQIIV